jgi:pimeloyl-ACP methyl ester carboxylesterase
MTAHAEPPPSGPATETTAPPAERTVRVAGTDLAYEEYTPAPAGGSGTSAHGEGQAPVLLFVHGHPFDRTLWRPQLGAFPGHRVIAPDLRGYGHSGVPGPGGTTTLESHASDLAGLLDALEVDRAVVAGISMGGQIVMEFLRLFPERAAGAVLADTFARGEDEPARRERRERADLLEREGMAGYAHGALASMITPANAAARPQVAAHVLGMMLAAPPAGAAAALRGRALRPDRTALLPSIAVPTLVVVGREDVFTPVADAEFLCARILGARLAVIDGAGHLPNLERPEAFNAALAGLLSAVDVHERR